MTQSKAPECRSRQSIGISATISAPRHDCRRILDRQLDKKYKNVTKEYIRQWIFPAFALTTVKDTGEKTIP